MSQGFDFGDHVQLNLKAKNTIHSHIYKKLSEIQREKGYLTVTERYGNWVYIEKFNEALHASSFTLLKKASEELTRKYEDDPLTGGIVYNLGSKKIQSSPKVEPPSYTPQSQSLEIQKYIEKEKNRLKQLEEVTAKESLTGATTLVQGLSGPNPASEVNALTEAVVGECKDSKDRWLSFHLQCLTQMHEITKRKNSDYTGDSDDPFFNFKVIEQLKAATMEQGFITRMTDKLCRIISLTKKEAQVKDESIEDTLLDLANYCLLFLGALKEKKRQNN